MKNVRKSAFQLSLVLSTLTALVACSSEKLDSEGQETLASSAQAPAANKVSNSNVVCQYNPEKTSKPNPLGMRTFVRLTLRGSDVTATYEQFPSIVSADPVPVTRSLIRYLTLPNRSLDSARQTLLERNDLWNELVGYEDSEGFKPVNDVLFCDSEQVQTPETRPQPKCSFDPESGKPNPLGMRHFITIFDNNNEGSKSNEISFVNEQFQYLVDSNLPAVAGYIVTLSVFNSSLNDAKSLVLVNGSKFGEELLRENGEDGSGNLLSELNAAIRCR
jgi:hypothetical protein